MADIFDFEETNDNEPIVELDIDNYYKYNLDEILRIEDKQIQYAMLNLYREELKAFAQDKLAPYILGTSKNEVPLELERSSIEYLVTLWDAYLTENTSSYWFSQDVVLVYNRYRVHVARKERVCQMCGERIRKNSKYIDCRPLLFNVSKNQAWYLNKSIIVKKDCRHHFPTSIIELETMNHNLRNAFTYYNDSDNLFPNNTPDNLNKVEYTEFASNYNDGLQFKKLIKHR